MILDNGICTVLRRTDRIFTPVCKSWYGELSFETQPSQDNQAVGVQSAARVRIHQTREVIKGDVAVLRNADTLSDIEAYYEVTRAYHGNDDDNGQPITDLTMATSLMTERLTLVPGEVSDDSMSAKATHPALSGRRTVAAEVQSISADEQYEAMAYGEKPEMKALIYADEYAGEPYVELDGTLYKIQRRNKNGKRLELTCGKV
jgi:SPP1 family predicted phage head-tail adaptor